MNSCTVTTGFGYFLDAQGHIVSKAELPKGEHPLREGFTYIEVVDKASLDAIEIYVDPAEIEASKNERKIQNKTRAMAIAELKASGDLPDDFPEAAI
jgi:hypothetical protein